jgi:hypothetical protein
MNRLAVLLFSVIAFSLLAVLLISGGCDKGNGNGNGGDVVVETNNAPVVLSPFIASFSQAFGAHVVIDLRHRVHGCKPDGSPETETGAYDPDGDSIRYRISCDDWSVFKLGTAERVNDTWVTFPMIARGDGTMEQDAVVELWVGWTGISPKMPVVTTSCDNTGNTRRQFIYEVMDEHGASSQNYIMVGI